MSQLDKSTPMTSVGSLPKATLLQYSRALKQLNRFSRCSRVKHALRLIAADISTSLTTPTQQEQKEPSPPLNPNVPTDEQTGTEIVVDDRLAVGTTFGNLLVPLTVDNDVESGPEEMERGVGLLYGELLYSVGEQLVSRRRRKGKKDTSASNKENQDCNRQQPLTRKGKGPAADLTGVPLRMMRV